VFSRHNSTVWDGGGGKISQEFCTTIRKVGDDLREKVRGKEIDKLSSTTQNSASATIEDAKEGAVKTNLLVTFVVPTGSWDERHEDGG